VEIGNEPAKYSEAQYRAIFEAMARGIRAGDPKLIIATCAVMTGKPDQWSKPTSAITGLEDLYDVLNVHSYAFAEKWPTWRRSYPEDSKIRFLKDVQDLMRWRDAQAKGKLVWITEFGYDSATKPPAANGQWAKWAGVTDQEQARYIVRSYLALAAAGVDRAYLYFFNDKDEPQLHGASGITRNLQPKPAFYAVSHLYKQLGAYRFTRDIAHGDQDLYCYEFTHADRSKRMYVAWIADGKNQAAKRLIPLPPERRNITSVTQLPMSKDESKVPEWKQVREGIEIEVSGDPIFIATD
jgi:serine/threonine-protein kinase ATR